MTRLVCLQLRSVFIMTYRMLRNKLTPYPLFWKNMDGNVLSEIYFTCYFAITKFGLNWPSGFKEEMLFEEIVDVRRRTKNDGRRRTPDIKRSEKLTMSTSELKKI